MGISQYTFIKKERRAEWDRIPEQHRQEERLLLWQGDRGNAAAEVILDEKAEDLELIADPVMNEKGNLSEGIEVRAEFQKWISTYTGSNWIPEPRPYRLPEAPKGDKSYSADVIYGSQMEREKLLEKNGRIIQPIWITVSTTQDAKPGLYSTKIRVRTEQGGEQSLKLKIRVLDLKLDQDNEYYLNLWQYPYASAAYYQVEPFGREHLQIMKRQMRPYMEAGGKIGTASIVEEPWYHQTWCDYPSMVRWKRENGKWQFEYGEFDRWTGFLLKEVKVSYIECYSVVPWGNVLRYREDGKEIEKQAEPGSEFWTEAWSAFLQSFVQHLEEKGWFDRMILAMDERPKEEMEAALNLIATFPDRHGNSLKVGGAVVHYNKEMWDRLFTVTPHLSALANEEIPQELFREIVRRRRQEGKLTSIYSMIHDYPGIFSMSDPGEAAWTIWYIESCGADGFLKWAYDAWCKDPLEENVHCYFEAGDMFLVYPGERREKEPDVRVSPRFRMLEEAIHDVRKLCQMKKVPEYEKKAEQLLDSVRCFYGKGKSNGVGTAGFMEADEQIKR